ncbi:hypothetical protein L9F63_008492 [Diploptera punctata]|uniref:CD80-like immunoglobulin C2-set domain-containing protein n=1 Tax=Diploptera punctata TaxID=6984 RepID=A0AAD8E1Q4_DIPPU|nr:hypothetical protein L9F63_008492 [Diploptera punctata]
MIYFLNTIFVTAYPSENPMIEGILSTYSIGDYVSANCTSGKSNPLANLTWYINEVKLGKQADSWVWEYPPSPEESDSQGLHTKTVGLQFQVLNTHLVNHGGFSPKVEIRCTSIVGESVRHMSVYPKLVRALTSNKLAQERNFNSAGE